MFCPTLLKTKRKVIVKPLVLEYHCVFNASQRSLSENEDTVWGI